MIQERKYFVCGGFRHITCHCRNRREIEKNRRIKVGGSENQPSSNKFKVLISRMMQGGIFNKRSGKKKKLLREATVKIGLKQEDNKDRITLEVSLDSRAISLIISLEFAKKNKFKKKKLDKLIYIRNVDSTFNYEGLIEHTVEMKFFYKGYIERMEINVIGEQE